MASDRIYPTEAEVENARSGTRFQVRAHGLEDMAKRSKDFREFLENQSQVVAAYAARTTAQTRMLEEQLSEIAELKRTIAG